MVDRDPLVHLSNADGAAQPDPEFAKQLLDSMLSELTAEDNVAVSAVQLVDTEADGATSTRSRPGLGLWILGAAAVVLLVTGGAIAFSQNSDDGSSSVLAGDPGASSPVEADPRPTPSPRATGAPIVDVPIPAPSSEEVAVQFMEARAQADGEALRSLIADDALIANEFAVSEPDDYLMRAEFEQAINFRMVDFTCSSLAPELVSCLYSFESDLSRALRSSPYSDYQVVLLIRDGLIHDVVGGAIDDAFGRDFETFSTWLEDNYPEDFDTLNIDPGESNPWLKARLSTEASVMVPARLAEFVVTFRPPLLKALEEDGRFSFVLDGLLRTPASDAAVPVRLTDLFDDCVVDGSFTLFAPTDSAVERFLTANNLERDALIGDAELAREVLGFFVVEQVITRTEIEALDQPTPFDTLHGEPITITGGFDPRVNSAGLEDAIAIEACNGVIHSVNELVIPSSVAEALAEGTG